MLEFITKVEQLRAEAGELVNRAAQLNHQAATFSDLAQRRGDDTLRLSQRHVDALAQEAGLATGVDRIVTLAQEAKALLEAGGGTPPRGTR